MNGGERGIRTLGRPEKVFNVNMLQGHFSPFVGFLWEIDFNERIFSMASTTLNLAYFSVTAIVV